MHEVLKIMQQSTVRSVRFSKLYIAKMRDSPMSQYRKAINCNPWVSPSFMFQVILFAAHAMVNALSSERSLTTHPNFHGVKQYLESYRHFSLFVLRGSGLRHNFLNNQYQWQFICKSISQRLKNYGVECLIESPVKENKGAKTWWCSTVFFFVC